MPSPLPESFHELIERIDAGLGSQAGRAVALTKNIGQAIRPIFFFTDHDEYQYATHGGTMFIVEFKGKLFAITCEHVFKDFPRERLFITADKQAKKGSPPAKIKGFYNPSGPWGSAEGTDITDLCIIEMSEEVTRGSFGGAVFVIDDASAGTATEGASLVVAGVLEENRASSRPTSRWDIVGFNFRTPERSSLTHFFVGPLPNLRIPSSAASTD